MACGNGFYSAQVVALETPWIRWKEVSALKLAEFALMVRIVAVVVDRRGDGQLDVDAMSIEEDWSAVYLPGGPISPKSESGRNLIDLVNEKHAHIPYALRHNPEFKLWNPCN